MIVSPMLRLSPAFSSVLDGIDVVHFPEPHPRLILGGFSFSISVEASLEIQRRRCGLKGPVECVEAIGCEIGSKRGRNREIERWGVVGLCEVRREIAARIPSLS